MRACRDLIAMVKEYKHFQDGSIWDQVVKAAEKEIGEAGVSSECNTGLCESASSQYTVQGCGICGGKLTAIRGRYPKAESRYVCPTCLQERIDQINEISSSGYGVACKAEQP